MPSVERLRAYSEVVGYDDLPRNGLGKVMKVQLRDRFSADHG